jgi:hypothetical protein
MTDPRGMTTKAIRADPGLENDEVHREWIRRQEIKYIRRRRYRRRMRRQSTAQPS